MPRLGLKSASGAHPAPIDYGTAKRIAFTGDTAARADLAGRADTQPEILYYLAGDEAASVRRESAANRHTPLQASPRLAQDEEPAVRSALAEKLARMLPDLAPAAQRQLYDLAVNAMKQLAEDHIAEVRIALSVALRDIAFVPPGIARQLAQDVERQVAEPMLRFCENLSDRDLLSIIATQPPAWVLQAIAGRPHLAEAISDGVAEGGDVAATVTLLDNDGAEIAPDTLERIAADQNDVAEIGAALGRRHVRLGIAGRMAGDIEASVRHVLTQDPEIDRATRREVAEAVSRRVTFAAESNERDAAERVARLHADGGLDDTAVRDAVAVGDRVFVTEALGRLARIPAVVADKILASAGARAITALTWRAGLSMRTAVALQKGIGQVPPRNILNAKGGDGYPLSEDSMRWQLEFFGIDD